MTDILTTSSGIEPKLLVDDEFVKAWQANCLDAPKFIERSSLALTFTSPPYPGVEQPELEYATFEDPMDFNESHAFLKSVWEICFHLTQDGGHLVVNLYDTPQGASGMYPNVAATVRRCLEIGWVLRATYIWHKGATYSPPHGSFPYPKGVLSANTYEPCLLFQKPVQFKQRKQAPSEFPQAVKDASILGNEEHQWLMNPIWSIPADREGRKIADHPFTFPTELPHRFIKLYTYAGELVFDPFLGSGTTAEAARKLNRIGIGTELSDKYAEGLIKRFSSQSLF